MKIIFLDIDGVLNNKWFFEKREPDAPEFGEHDIDIENIYYLNRLVKETGALLVISSSWRNGYPLTDIQRFLEKNGFKYPERVIGTTMSDTKLVRGGEIKKWLDLTGVEKFVILDDDSDMGEVIDNLVQTQYEDGLTSVEMFKAIEILGKE